MDEATVNARGIDPVKPWIAEIKAAGDHQALAVEMAHLEEQGVGGLFRGGVQQDDKAPENYIFGFSQGGIGLPDRDYYLKDDPKLADTRAKYQAYLGQMLGLAGQDGATARAAAVYAFEKTIAEAHWDRIKSRDSDLTYNKWAAADFPAKAPGFPWHPYFKTIGIAREASYLVGMPSAVTEKRRPSPQPRRKCCRIS